MRNHVMNEVKTLSCALLAGGLLALFGMTTQAWAKPRDVGGDSLATAARIESPPKIDGKISKGEWDGAVRASLFTGWRRLKFEAREAAAWAAYDKNNLYIAVSSELRPGGLIAEKKFDDGRLVFDSCIEIWIDPNRDNRKQGKGDLSYYQIIGNSIGAKKDVKFALGAPDAGWNVNGEYENHIDEEAGLWTTEIAIPWKDLGWADGAQPGRTIGLVIARDFKNPWTQPTWMPLGASFSSVGEYPVVRLTENDPVVRIEQLRHDTFLGGTPLQVKVANPGAARNVKVDMLITSTDMPKIEKSEELKVDAGGAATFEYQVPQGRLHERASHTLNLLVTDVGSGDVLFRHKGGNWHKAPTKKWHVQTGPNPAAAAKVGYYPSYHILKVWLQPEELGKDHADTRTARIIVWGPEGETLYNAPYKWSKDQSVGVWQKELPELEEGRYSVEITFPGYEETLTRHFTHREFHWEGNELGITDEIFPPFEPMKQDGDTVSVVMRKYKMNGLGLWDSVQAKGNETPFKELLAGPMSVKLSMKSAAVDAEGQVLQGKGTVVSAKSHEVIYEGEASHPAVAIKTRSITEYDGCMRVEMDLMPGEEKQEIKSLWIDIPVKDELAPLYHVSTTALRYNPAGDTPAGEGLIWDTRDFPDGEWPTGFRPYVWIGAEERGLCWFADNDKDWVKDVDFKKGTYAPAFSLHRNKGVLTLRVHLVQKPVTLERKRHIVFGLMATPAKPMPEDWRAIGRPDHPGFYFSMGHVHGLYTTYSSKYPINYDWTPFDLNYARRSGQKIENAKAQIAAWKKRNLTDEIGKAWREKVQKLVNMGWRRGRKDPMSVYFEEFHSTTVKGGAEAPAFYTEWTGDPLKENFFKGKGPWAIRMGTGALVESYRDFACWFGAEWLKRGYGLYFDNSFPKRTTDTLTTAAYEWKGIVVPSASMWNHRKYLKRIWIMHQQMRDPKAPQAMMIHMTNTNIAPYMVWNEYNLDLEWRNSDEPLQKRFSPDLLRAESLGLKTGNVPVVLHFSGGPAMLVHEIKTGITVREYPEPFVKFGYGLDDCEVFNYWDENTPVSINDPECKWLLLKRDGKLLLYLVTWNGQESKLEVSLNLEDLGVNVTKVVNAENDDAVTEINNGAFAVDMKGFGVQTLILEP